MRMALLRAALVLASLPASGATIEYRLELVRESLTGVHCRYREVIDGVESDRYATYPCLETAPPAAGQRIPSPLRRVNGRVVRRYLVEDAPLERYEVDVDLANGAVVRRVPLFFRGKAAAVFDPNPVASLNAPGLQDQNDAASAVPPAAYHVVDLNGVAASGPLRGPWATMVDRQPPQVAPPDAAGSLIFDRQQDGFEDVNAYFHITRNQEYVQSLGYTGSRAIAPYSIEVDAHSLNGGDNSVFLPSITSYGRGTLHFGEGGTDDAEDADLVVHEYGHALLEWIAPGTFGGSFSSESRALAEGFCDYWAYAAHRSVRAASGRDLYCIADWDARCWLDEASQRCGYAPGSDCLRRVDGTLTMADYLDRDTSGTEHLNGSIWSSALREVHDALIAMHGAEEGRAIAASIILESFFGAPPKPTYAVMGQRLIESDRLLYNGAHTMTICAAMATRGIVGACDVRPRGELTLFQSAEPPRAISEGDPAGVVSTLTIEDPRQIERLLVRVDIEHSARGDLRVELIAPDGAVVLLQQVSNDRQADVHVTFGLDSEPAQPLEIFRGRSAAGTWRLRVSDLRVRDQGTLVSWGLLIQFAGDARLTARPVAPMRSMIPVVAHSFGVNDTTFRSDLRIANPTAEPRTVTLLFTPSGHDGRSSFSAIDVFLPAGQTVAFEDVVSSAFAATGSGSLEVLGDVVVMSRTVHASGSGTVGTEVPPISDTTAVGEGGLYVNGLLLPGWRFNVGITETAGGSGTIRVETSAATRELTILPFSNVQFLIAGADAKVTVTAGMARVGVYLAQVEYTNGDAMLIPGRLLESRAGIAPAASASGVDGTFWSSDFWSAVPEIAFPHIVDISYRTGDEELLPERLDEIELDVVATVFSRPGTVGALIASLPAPYVAHTRINAAGTSQYVPFLNPDGPALQHLPFLDNAGAWRTNIGFVSLEPALAEITVFDASGAEVERRLLWTERGLAQLSLANPVTAGRAEVRFLAGSGRAYASVIDQRTRDATLFVSE